MSQKKPRFNIEMYGSLLHGAGLAVVSAAVAGAVFFVYRPIGAEMTALADRSGGFATFLEDAEDIRARNAVLSAELSEKERKLNLLYEQIPDSARESDFLAQLSELAREGELAIRNYKPGTPMAKDRHSEMEIALSAQGSYEGICRFLSGLGELPRVCRVSTLQIIVPNQEGDEYTVELTLRIYFSSSKTVEQQGAGGVDA